MSCIPSGTAMAEPDDERGMSRMYERSFISDQTGVVAAARRESFAKAGGEEQ